MKVLTASSTDLEARTVRGELVVFPFTCDREGCGCGQRWLGLGSGATCTVATVVDKPDVTRDALVDALAATLRQATLPAYTEADAREDASEVVDEVLAIAARFPPGTRLCRDGDDITQAAQPRRGGRSRGRRSPGGPDAA